MAVQTRPHPTDRSGWGVSDPALLKRRAWAGAAFLALAFCGLLMRLWYLQVVEGADFRVMAEQNRVRPVPLPAPRGLILDRNDRVLATSRITHSIAVVPAALPSARRDPEGRAKVLRTLGFLIGVSAEQIEAKIRAERERGLYDPIRIVPHASYKTIAVVEENKARLGPAVLVTNDLARTYPNGILASHVMGYTGIVQAKDLEENHRQLEAGQNARQLGLDDIIGQSGVEKEYDRDLTGIRGSERYEVDSRLRPIRALKAIPEKPGHTLQLTLDLKLQQAAEAGLSGARNSGAVAVIDVRNGDVLALASRPTFNPNIFSMEKKQFRTAFNKIVRNKKHPLINRAVSSRFPPGSTFKMITAAAALESNAVNTGSSWHCGGGLRMGRFFGCWDVHGPGVNLAKALSHSCDVYFYQAALRMGNPESSGPTYLAKIGRQFGLGVRTGIDLPTDAAGLMPDPAWRREYNRKNPAQMHWYAGNTLNMSIGQGDVLTSPLQMALVTAAVANGGTHLRPHLLKAVRDANGRVVKQPKIERRSVGINGDTIELIRQGMRRVVTNGTGKAVALPHVAVAGKTGSAEDANHALPHAWFVCFAPYDNPKIAIAVIIENSGHGSENAVPVCKKNPRSRFPRTEENDRGHALKVLCERRVVL